MKTIAKRPENKTHPTNMSVAAFINDVENEVRRKDAKRLLAMMKGITGEKPKLWAPSIIGFGEYHYKYESGREGDMLLVGFSPRKSNLVLYVLGSIEDDDPLLVELGKFRRGKSCLYIKSLEDVDINILEHIVTKSFTATKTRWNA